MRVLLLIASIIYTCQALGCCSGIPTISESFNSSDVVFYGKHIETKISDYFLSNGRPAKIDNFEVIRLYKGGTPSLLEDTAQKYLISIQSACDNSSCMSRCFNPNRYYLIYAHHSPYSGMMVMHECARYREIMNEQFKTPLDFDREYWIKDEHAELLKLAQLNQTAQAQSFPTMVEKKDREIRRIERELTSLKSVLFRYKFAVYSLFVIMFLEILGFGLRKKRRMI